MNLIICATTTPRLDQYTVQHMAYAKKAYFIRIYCITDLLKIRNTIFDSLLRMRQHGHTLPAAEEGDLKL